MRDAVRPEDYLGRDGSSALEIQEFWSEKGKLGRQRRAVLWSVGAFRRYFNRVTLIWSRIGEEIGWEGDRGWRTGVTIVTYRSALGLPTIRKKKIPRRVHWHSLASV